MAWEGKMLDGSTLATIFPFRPVTELDFVPGNTFLMVDPREEFLSDYSPTDQSRIVEFLYLQKDIVYLREITGDVAGKRISFHIEHLFSRRSYLFLVFDQEPHLNRLAVGEIFVARFLENHLGVIACVYEDIGMNFVLPNAGFEPINGEPYPVCVSGYDEEKSRWMVSPLE